jgi:oligopeptide/dipeptide ABC transporter ATP-binding protein
MPYTRALLNALPTAGKKRLEAIAGQPPDLSNLPVGCPFSPRCPFVIERCKEEPGLLEVEAAHMSACWRASDLLGMPPGKTLASS